MAIRDSHNAKVYEQNRLDAIQKSKRKDMQLCILGSVMQQPSGVCNTWCIYDNNEHTLVWVASWLPRIKDRMMGRCICRVWQHVAPLPHQRCAAIVITNSLRAYELTQRGLRYGSDINKPARALSSMRFIGFTMHEAMWNVFGIHRDRGICRKVLDQTLIERHFGRGSPLTAVSMARKWLVSS
jgi:hypothetical protein